MRFAHGAIRGFPTRGERPFDRPAFLEGAPHDLRGILDQGGILPRSGCCPAPRQSLITLLHPLFGEVRVFDSPDVVVGIDNNGAPAANFVSCPEVP